MRLDTLQFSVPLLLLLGFALIVADHRAYWGLLRPVLCLCAATTILYVSCTRAEYLWLGALGGVALMLTPLSATLTANGPVWPDVICVAVFVGFIARKRAPSSGGGHGSGYRAR